ncbi:Ig-like domain-containing protein [Kitasatospora sp. NPDC056327]|uniref:Ig-like domain-containing protein n=1 Tax=Kitasatospora sp. NPDC056327 TaxID=3345785 RepID=UPI0035DF7785
MNRQFPAAAVAAAVLATGLLVGWNPPPSAAQQSPGTWSAERRAVLPSGLSVRLDFSAAPGVAAEAAPGELAGRSGISGSTASYADGIRPGDPAQTFRISEDRPQTDGSWRTVGTLRLEFSRPVRNPRLHLSGLAGTSTGKSGSTVTGTRLTVTGGSPAAPSLVNRTDWPGWTVGGNALAPARAAAGTDGGSGSVAGGSLELAGTLRSAVFRVEQRSTAGTGSATAAPAASGPLVQAYTVTLDEGVGTAPQGYGNASHLLSDLFLGGDAGTRGARPDARPALLFRGADAGRADAGGADGAGNRARGEAAPPPALQPGRGDYQGADPAVGYPEEAEAGRPYRLAVPVEVGDAPATLVGWVDFDHNGRFDAAERVQTGIAPGERSATLGWTVPGNASSGETWARLRIGRDAAQLVSADGFADSGQVADQRIRLTVGAVRPDIAQPADGSTVTEARPRISGERAASGATVEIREGDTALCRARAARGGDWSCRPDAALGDGPHTLTPVQTAGGGAVLRGEPVRITVRTAPPGVPVLTLPEFTNDPGLQLTGTGEPGSTVIVTDRPSGGADGPGGPGASGGEENDLCSTAVRADGGWSCLPVENLPDGRHRLTPAAADLAGHRTGGQPVELVVDTVAPDRPVLTAPAAGETVRSARPRLAGKAEPGAGVLVTAGPDRDGAAARIVACGATAAVDGSWTCTANRDLADGEQWLVVTATDRAGNGTAAEAVEVRVASGVTPVPPATPATPVPGTGPTAAASVPPVGTSPSFPVASSAATATASAGAAPTGTPAPTPPVSPTGAATAPAVPTPSVSSPAVPTPSVSSPAVPTPSVAAPTTPALPSPTLPLPSPSASVPSSSLPPFPTSAPTVAPTADPTRIATATPAVVPVPSSGAEPGWGPVPDGLLPIVVPPVGGAAVRPVLPSPSPTAARPSATGSPVPSPAHSPARSAVRSTSPAPVAPAPSSSLPTPPAPTAPSPSPSPSATPPSGQTAAPSTAPSVTPAAVPAPGEDRDRPDRGPAAPPERDRQQAAGAADPAAEAEPPSSTAADRHRSYGWRGALAGVLLLLTGIGLIARRALARETGHRRS